MNSEYSKAYTEVLALIRELPKEELAKIPKEEIDFFMANCDKEYKFKINKEIPLNEQNISKKANAVLVSIFKKYFATETQKKKIDIILKNNLIEEERIKKENFNYKTLEDNNLNKIKSNEEKIENEYNGLEITKYKKNSLKNIFNKIKNSIKRLFFKNK